MNPVSQFNYDPEQTAAIQTKHSTTLVIAGAGSGKTRTLIARIEYLLNHGVNPADIVCITFTNAAAQEIQKRVNDMADDSLSNSQVEREFKLGYCGTLHSFMLRLIREKGNMVGLMGQFAVADEDQREKIIEDIIARTKWTGSRAALEKEIDKGPMTGPATARLDKIQIIAQGFYQTLRTAGLLDFNSILHYGLQILQLGIALPFKYLFVDEFQDSGDLDFEIYRKLDVANKFFVGDPDQSIYSFRGGNVRNIIRLAQSAFVLRLEKNYRSAKNICKAAQALIVLNTERVEKKTVAVTEDFGSVELWANIDAPGREVAMIARDMEAFPENKCAVLVRSNYLAREYARLLTDHGVKVSRKEFDKFPEDWKRTRLFISLLTNPYSDVIAKMYLSLKSGDGVAAQIARRAEATMQSINEVHFKLEPQTAVADVCGKLVTEGISEESRQRVLDSIRTLPAGSEVIDLNFALGRDLAHRDEVGEGVTVTTIHSAKGREWHTVFLPAFEQSIIPGSRQGANIEEERRLAYVAFTRAQRRLIIYFCKERATEWSRRPVAAEPSQFIEEAGLNRTVNKT